MLINDKPHGSLASPVASGKPVKIDLTFQGHYKEPNLQLEVPFQILNQHKEIRLNMTYDPSIGCWKSVRAVSSKNEVILEKIVFNQLDGSSASTTASGQSIRSSSISKPIVNNKLGKQGIVKPRAASVNKTAVKIQGRA